MIDVKYELFGVGSILRVYDDKLTIEPRGFIGSLTRGLFAGVKTIPIHFIQNVQFRKASRFVNGRIYFCTVDSAARQIKSELNDSKESSYLLAALIGNTTVPGDENTITFKADSNDVAEQIKDFVEAVISSKSENTINISDADEILKFKSLLDEGVITIEEFNHKKRQIIGI